MRQGGYGTFSQGLFSYSVFRFGGSVKFGLIKLWSVVFGYVGYVEVRSVDMGYGELRSGKSVKFRQGPSGSVELRRVGFRRFCCGKVR